MEIACDVFSERPIRGTPALIFVTVGNATQSFRRLIEAVASLTEGGELMNEDVYVQNGHSGDVSFGRCRHDAFIGATQFIELIKQAEVVICHAGAGTLIHALQAGRTPVVMPRLAKYGEHVDDHQLELVSMLAGEGRIIPAYEVADLSGAIRQARQRRAEDRPKVRSLMIELVKEAIETLGSVRT